MQSDRKLMENIRKAVDIDKNISEKIKKIRTAKGMTTYQLANITGIPQSTISKIENGKMENRMRMLQKIADALDVSIGYLTDEIILYDDGINDREAMLDVGFSIIRKLNEASESNLEVRNTVESLELNNKLVTLDVFKKVILNTNDNLLYVVFKDNSVYYFDASTLELVEHNVQVTEHESKTTIKSIEEIPEEFTNAKEAREYIKKHYRIFASEGIEIDKLDDEKILNFANELLEQMKLVAYKYKK